MCSSPVLVSRRSSTRCDLATGLAVEDGKTGKLRYYKKIRPSSSDFFYNNYLVPCGHCSQCLKKRQNDLAARCSAEAAKRGSMIFITLTYDDANLPLRLSLERVNKDTGEISTPSHGDGSDALPLEFVERGSDLDFYVRNELSKLDKSKPRYVYTKFFETDLELYRYCITPSLCRRDIQLWIKNCRVKYERDFHTKLAKFSYVCCGEYGPNTFRPHYHLAFFGLGLTIANWFADQWRKKFGFVYVQKVNSVNSDGSSGFDACSKYIGKYMSKGCFECESVKVGAASKPRLMCSIGVGDSEPGKVVSDALLGYYRCYDLVGKYSINDGKKDDGSFLTSSDFDLIAKEIPKRSTISFGSYIYPLPIKLKHYIWYEKNAKGYYVSSAVKRQLSTRLQVDFFEDFVRKCTKDYTAKYSSEIASQISEFIYCQFSCSETAEIRGMQSLGKFYKQSKF